MRPFYPNHMHVFLGSLMVVLNGCVQLMLLLTFLVGRDRLVLGFKSKQSGIRIGYGHACLSSLIIALSPTQEIVYFPFFTVPLSPSSLSLFHCRQTVQV